MCARIFTPILFGLLAMQPICGALTDPRLSYSNGIEAETLVSKSCGTNETRLREASCAYHFTLDSQVEKIVALSANEPVEAELKGGEVHAYSIGLKPGQYAHIRLDQLGIDVVLTLFSQNGTKLVEADRPNGSYGPEELVWIATNDEKFRLQVRSLEPTASLGRYRLQIAQLRNSTTQDKKKLRAQEALIAGTGLISQGKSELLQEAIGSLSEALKLWQETDELGSAAYSARPLADLYRDQHDYQKAIEFYQQARSFHQAVKDLSGEAAVLTNLGSLYSSMGEIQKALVNFNQSLPLYRELGDKHDEAVTSNNIGNVYENIGAYSEALKYFETAIAIFKEAADARNEAAVLNNAGEAYTYLGQYQKALDILQRALAVHRASGDRYREASSLHGIGSVYAEMRQGRKALEYLNQALELRKSVGDKSGEATTRFEIGVIYWDLREYQKSLDHTFRALDSFREIGDRGGEAAALYHIGWVYFSMANNQKATEFLPQALQVYKALNHKPGQITTLDTLSRAWANSGNFRQALECTMQKLSLLKERPDQRGVAEATAIIGILYAELGDALNAIDYLQRALQADRAAGNRREEAICLNGIGWLYYTQREYQKAESFFEDALAIWKSLDDADEQAKVLYNLAELKCTSGAWQEASRFLAESLDLEEAKLRLELLAGGEWEKQFFVQSFIRSLQLSVAINANYASKDVNATQLALTTILRRKGRVLDAISDQSSTLRRSAGPETVALLNELNQQVSRQSQLKIRGPQNLSPRDYQASINDSQEKIEELELKLNASNERIRSQNQAVTLDAVQQRIPDDAALVEFLVWSPFQPDRDWRNKFGKARYIAYVLFSTGSPKVVDMGEVQRVNALAAKLRNELRDPLTEIKELKDTARALDELIMRPVRQNLAGKNRLLISPDGQLNLVPFAALVNERGEYLVTKYKISYLTSGRDLLRLEVSPKAKDPPLIIANPDFEDTGGGDKNETTPATRSTLLNQMRWAALPGTENEAKAIKNLLPNATLKLGAQATETQVKQVVGPSIVHFATHGFFLPDVIEDEQPLTTSLMTSGITSSTSQKENRMLRSGLVLAGANQKRSADEDGILTASEMAGLNLWGTKLVVLSACETGLGDVQAGEGVYGLRRAIVLAGAEAQVMSLWKVDDKITAKLMADYYANLLNKGIGRADALREVQLSMLGNKETSHPYLWAAFIESGAWDGISLKLVSDNQR